MLKVSIGIPAYNEEANIGHLLKSIQNQKLRKIRIEEIIVIASGCTDGTTAIVKEAMRKNPKINLLAQSKRLGKSVANNLFIQKAQSEILILACADTLPKKDCLENLVTPFTNPKIGVTAARMIPLNNKESLAGYFSHLWWRLFHKVSLKFFRAGELMAFRKVTGFIPKEIGCDEVYLIDEILDKGFKAKYTPRAVAYNMGPQTVGDIILMRRRHASHHFQFRKLGPKTYYPKTMDNLYVFELFLKEIKWHLPKEVVFAFSSLFLEGLSRLLAYYDFYFGEKNDKIWPRSESTKKLK